MPWPISQDYNEAIQDPSSCFADPDLKQGEAAVNALGIPMPRSGNFADVYEVTTPRGKWAVKCFTRQIPGIRERYKEVSAYLGQTPLPFMVDFTFLEQGIRVRGDWYPVLKMPWVEGFNLNQFVKDNLDKPAVLDLLCQIWVKLAAKLREAEMAHCDLQHGNVLLVPGSKAGNLAIKLVDYDGMCVPALTLLKTIEVGHPNFQHPQRARDGIYSLEVDRFSHLVIYTSVRALQTGGKALWAKFDNGDNLLFKASDFQKPKQSALFATLLKFPDRGVQVLTEHMMAALSQPLAETPLLEELAPTLPAMTKKVTTGLKKKPDDAFAGVSAPAVTKRPAKKGNGLLAALIAAGVVGVLAIGGAAAFLMSGNSTEKEAKVTQKAPDQGTKKSEPRQKEPKKVEPKKIEPEPKKVDTKTVEDVAETTDPVEAAPPTYLADMTEENVVVDGKFEKGAIENIRHGLFTHPLINGASTVTYRLKKPFGRFVGEAAILRRPDRKQEVPATPLTFEVLLDGKSAWKSGALSKIGESQAFDVDVSDAGAMELKVHCPGKNDWAWAVWVEPRLLPAGSETLKRKPLYFVRMKGDQLLTTDKSEVANVERDIAGSRGTFLGFGCRREQPGTKKIHRCYDSAKKYHDFDLEPINRPDVKNEDLDIWVLTSPAPGTEPIYKLQLPDGCFIYAGKATRDAMVASKEARDLGVIFHVFAPDPKMALAIRDATPQWIWVDEGDPTVEAPAGTRYFRKTFEVAALPDKADLRMTADNRFTVWVNGTKIGATRIGSNIVNGEDADWTIVRGFDVRPALRVGKNVIAVEAVNTKASPAGVVVRLRLTNTEGRTDIVTDGSWKTNTSSSENWLAGDFSDKEWSAARVLGPLGRMPWGNLNLEDAR